MCPQFTTTRLTDGDPTQRVGDHPASDVIGGSELPKGAYRLPDGSIMLPPTMADHRIVGRLRAEVDVRRFTKALLDVAKRMQDEDEHKAA